MCGILGALPAIDSQIFDKGLGSLHRRGPDSQNIWNEENHKALLGHTRLAILDLSEFGNQPMHWENLVIVFNGEIFNYLELKEELETAGYKFTTNSDTEVILKAYHYWGKACFNKFNGMWALAIYDKEENSLLICRDRYGIKPVYYINYNGQFLFGSEVQAIHKILGKNHPLNQQVLRNIAAGGFAWHGSEESYLQDVRVLPGGHLIEYKRKSVNIKKWYVLLKVETPHKFEEQAEHLRILLFDAIRLRLRSDVPIGTCLSGGVDSGTISSFIRQMEREGSNFEVFTHRSFCAAFPETPVDESQKAKRLADQLELQLDVINIKAPDPMELEKAMSQCDGPMHALAFYPIWKLYQYIKSQGITVTLDGQGPDEMLGGYKPLRYALLGAMQNGEIKYFIDLYKTYSAQGESNQNSSIKASRQITKGVIENAFKDKVKMLIGRGTISDKSQQSGPRFLKNIFDRNLHYQFFNEPLPAILQQYDRCSMAHAVECRMPLMDYRIVEFIFSLPSKSKVGDGYTKRVLRAAVRGILHDDTRLDKAKIGFNAPIIDWFRNELKDWMLDIMNSKSFLESSFFDGRQLQHNFHKFLNNDNAGWREAWQFWGAIHITKWQDNGNK